MRPFGEAFHARLPAIIGSSAASLSTEAPHRACSGVATQSSAIPPRDRTGVWFLRSESFHTCLPRFDACEPRGLATPTRSRSVDSPRYSDGARRDDAAFPFIRERDLEQLAIRTSIGMSASGRGCVITHSSLGHRALPRAGFEVDRKVLGLQVVRTSRELSTPAILHKWSPWIPNCHVVACNAV